MQRNFYSRVETCFPVEDPRMKARVIEEGLQAYLADTQQSWTLGADGRYRRVKPPASARTRSAQETLLASLAG